MEHEANEQKKNVVTEPEVKTYDAGELTQPTVFTQCCPSNI